MPFANVDDADVEVMLRAVDSMPCEKVVVALPYMFTLPVELLMVKRGDDVPIEKRCAPFGVVLPIESGPANEEVAVVEVARSAARVGVEVETSVREASNEVSMLPPTEARVSAPAESKDDVAVCPKNARFDLNDAPYREVEVASVARRLAKTAVPVNVGEALYATTPVPVSSESQRASCAEFAKSDEVAVSTQSVPLCMRRSPYAAAVMVTSLSESS